VLDVENNLEAGGANSPPPYWRRRRRRVGKQGSHRLEVRRGRPPLRAWSPGAPRRRRPGLWRSPSRPPPTRPPTPP